jgi:hypothetical protein
MNIAQVLAVYRVSPLLLVVEVEDGTVVELSLKAIEDDGHRRHHPAPTRAHRR